MSKAEYRIKEYDDTVIENGVRSIVKHYRPQRKDNTFINRLLGGGWYNLKEYPFTDLEKAKQVIENEKLLDQVNENKSVRYINVD